MNRGIGGVALNSWIRSARCLAIALALTMSVAGSAAALSAYSQDFEGLTPTDGVSSNDALFTDGWLVFGNVYDLGGGFLYNYGPFPAPNGPVGGWGFSAVVPGEGGPNQGAQVLSVFSDYNNQDHNFARIEANVFQEQMIDPVDVGTTWRFSFEAKPGVNGPVDPSTAIAFIKTLDPNAGFALTSFLTLDMTVFPSLWQEDLAIDLFIDGSLSGQILQFGFLNTATGFAPTTVFYDNVSFSLIPEPGSALLVLAGLTGLLVRRRSLSS